MRSMLRGTRLATNIPVAMNTCYVQMMPPMNWEGAVPYRDTDKRMLRATDPKTRYHTFILCYYARC